MSAGIPGLGLGALFFILSALLAPALELVRTARGRSSLDAWRRVGRQFAIGLAMLIALKLTLFGLLVVISLVEAAEGLSDHGVSVLPLTLIGVTGALLATVLGAVMALDLCLRLRERGAALDRPAGSSHGRDGDPGATVAPFDDVSGAPAPLPTGRGGLIHPRRFGRREPRVTAHASLRTAPGPGQSPEEIIRPADDRRVIAP